MIRVLQEKSESNKFIWLDLEMPTIEELYEIAEKYDIHHSSVIDFLDSEHLPKFETFSDGKFFVIVRVFDAKSSFGSDSIQELTRKVAIFAGKDFLITIHRSPQSFLSLLCENSLQLGQHCTVNQMIGLIMGKALFSYDKPLDGIENLVDIYEKRMFMKSRLTKQLQQFYILKKRASVFKKVIYITKDVVQKVSYRLDGTHSQELQDNFLYIETEADQKLEMVNNLLNLYLSLSSQKTNDVMQVLTMISVFFMPLTFIVGLYGMNFRIMPELEWHYGYLFSWILMILVTIIIYLFFKKKKWL